MKKLSFVGAALVAMSVAGFAFAGMDDVTISATASGISTNAGGAAYVIRGTVEGVVVTITGNGTPDNTVTLTSADGQTIFARAACAVGTNTYAIAAPLYLASTGAALTDTHYYSTNASAAISYTVAKYGGIPCASKVSLSVASLANSTNTTAVKILYRN